MIKLLQGDCLELMKDIPDKSRLRCSNTLFAHIQMGGGIILDNCMGSGSTGIASIRTGRDFIGIELDKSYYETAEQRISSYVSAQQINS